MPEKTENNAELIKQYKAGWVAGKRDAHLSYMRQIAEKDAEIARLRDVLSLFTAYESLMDDGEDVAAMAAYANLQLKVHEALKGPEA